MELIPNAVIGMVLILHLSTVIKEPFPRTQLSFNLLLVLMLRRTLNVSIEPYPPPPPKKKKKKEKKKLLCGT